MRAVLDTNVLISTTLIRDGADDRILRAWQRGAFDLALSPTDPRRDGEGLVL